MYLAALASPKLAPRHPILIAGDFDGYIQAAIRDDQIHLNYIGVHPRAMGQGLGGELLAAFHELGRATGCRRATLGVFASNPRVLEWYIRNGYTETARTELAIVDLLRVEPRSAGIVYEDLPSALADEEARGFSMVMAKRGDEDGHVGLAAGDTLRPFFSLAPSELAAAMRMDFPLRTRLILSGEIGDLPTLDRQTSLQLEREL